MTRAELIARADAAAQELANPILRSAFERIERDAIEAMLAVRGAGEDADLLRREASDRVRTIRDVQAALTAMIAEGQQAGRRPPTIA